MDESILDQAARLIEMERAQIGHEIHDALLPLIFAASAGVSTLSDKHSVGIDQARLQQVAEWLDDAMQTGRRLLTEIYPPELTDTPWAAAAQDTLHRLLEASSSNIDWRLAPEVNEVPKPVAFAAYRITVEAVRNAIRHGAATEVSIDGHKTAQQIRLVIHDNGRGFDPSHVTDDRFGIRTMKARAQLVGGSLAVRSANGAGTTVTFTTPSA